MKKKAKREVNDLRPEYDASLIRGGVRGKYAKHWTAAELLKLPPRERDAVLAAAAELAEPEYRTDPTLTAFEAFAKDDLHGESSSTETR